MQIKIDRDNLVLFKEYNYFGTLISTYQLDYVTKYANDALVQKMAYELLSFLSLKKLPVSPKAVAASFGIDTVTISSLSENERFKQALFGLDGFSVFNKQCNKYKIVYDDSYYTRSLFTIAHEIGHIILGHFKDSEIKERSSYDKNLYALSEVQANAFARHLLMPFPVLLKIKENLLCENRFSEQAFTHCIMRVCNTSQQAVKYAMIQFNMWEKKIGETQMCVLEQKIYSDFSEYIDTYVFKS